MSANLLPLETVTLGDYTYYHDPEDSELLTFFYNQLSQKSSVGIVVLLFHVFLWLILKNDDRIVRPLPDAKDLSTRYMIVVPIPADSQPVHALHQKINSLTGVTQKSQTTSMPVPVRRRVIRSLEPLRQSSDSVQVTVGNDHSKSEPAPEKSSTSSELPSQAADSEPSKQGKALDYDAIKRGVRESAHEFAVRPLPGASKPVSEAEKFENAVGRAKRTDCRTHHAQLGILAIPFLLKDTITDTGCKW